jgi:hypothetical protein
MSPHRDFAELFSVGSVRTSVNSASRIAPQGKRQAAWFVPEVDSLARGGIQTALRVAEHLSISEEVNNLIVICPLGHTPKAALSDWRNELAKNYPEMSFTVIFHKDFEERDDFGTIERGFATLWTTAYLLHNTHKCRRKIYFVQDYEPQFYAAGGTFGLIQDTYRLGLEMVCNTPPVEKAVASHASTLGHFLPGISDVYYPINDWVPRHMGQSNSFRLFLFMRPANERNGFTLLAKLASSLKSTYGSNIEIVAAGADFEESAFGLEGVLLNLGRLPSQQHVADFYRSCDMGVALSFSAHLSYQPLELLKTGVPLVTNASEASDWILSHEKNCLKARPNLHSLTASVVRMIEDENLRRTLRA